MTVEILTSKKGLMENISPTGIKYAIEAVPTGHALFRIRTPNNPGTVPADLAGTYTSARNAQAALTTFLLERWKESDAVAAKSKGVKVA